MVRRDIHIAYAGFGIKNEEWEHLLKFADDYDVLIRSNDTNPYDRLMDLRQLYDDVFEISPYGPTNPDPLALVALSPRENIAEHSAYYHAIRRYRTLRINEKFGLSLVEYLDLPRDVVELISRILEAEIKTQVTPPLPDKLE